jgi:hypothetical protein
MKSIEDEENELKKSIVWGNGIDGDTEITGKGKDDWVVVAFGIKEVKDHILFEKIKGARWNKETGEIEKYQEGPVFFKDLSSDMRSRFLEGARIESLLAARKRNG